MKQQIILGIAGTCASGKGRVSSYLCEKYAFTHYSVTGFLLEEIRKRSLPEDRSSMWTVANELRAQHGGDYIVRILIDRARADGGHAIVESIRAPLEADYINAINHAYLISVDADVELRYARTQLRKSEKDDISFQTFLEQEAAEMSNSDPAMQNIRYCIDSTDSKFRLHNNGSEEDLLKNVDTLIQYFK